VSGIFVLLLIGIATIDYLIGNRIANRRTKGKSSKWWVALSVTINVGILAYFKAGGFLEQTLNELIDGSYISLGVIAIPTGVSFFIFQSISYIVDISRGTIAPVKRFIDYLFLLSFFPKIFLGPLVRNKDFIPQIESDNLTVTREDIGRAVALIARGLLKYAVLAKAIDSLLLIPATAGDFGEGGMVMLISLIAFGIRLYCDFSGYSDIAIGIALVMGYKLPDNFDAPFKSATITEFWRRWHISLSTWLREYVYISLGGNRKGFARQLFNLVVVMLVCAMWHKVNMPYLVWGLMHGLGLALHKVWLTYVPNSKVLGKDMKPLWRTLATAFTFIFVTASWAMICRNDWAGVFDIYNKIFSGIAFADLVAMAHQAGFALVLVVIGYTLHFLPKQFNDLAIKAITRTGFVGQLVVMVITIWMVMQCQLMLAGDGGGLPVYAAF
jgi:D-alanyl-lipoteichoic acid acyltransferase DltB (MBOAT superfamily)